jgi:hypothetical protein
MRLSIVSSILLVSAVAQAAPNGTRPRVEYVPSPPDPTAVIVPGGEPPRHRIIYMNRFGATLTPGMNNSTSNTTTLFNNTTNVPAYTGGDARWAEVMACMREIYGPFNVTITEEDPGETPHIESIVGGTPTELGLDPGIGGIAPSEGCGNVAERTIVFTFEIWDTARDECETAAQETAHAFGLDHEFLCQDPMTYLFGCGNKTFQDIDAQCGEFEARLCRCGGATQNSVQVLRSVLGDPDHVPPTISITEPADGATVEAGFTVRAEADDDVSIDRVELWIDGELVETDVFTPYEFVTPIALSFGAHDVEARAVDFGGNIVPEQIAVTVEAGCQTSNDCDAGEECVDMRCMAGLGSPCTGHDDCASSTCVTSPEGELTCTQTCAPADEGSCPAGFECAATGLCWEGGGGGGGCSTATVASRAPSLPVIGLVGLGLVLGIVVFRRRR